MELKEGDYYYSKAYNHNYILKLGQNTQSIAHIIDYERFNKNGDFKGVIRNGLRKATLKEINWLNACIKIDKFIPLSEVKEEYTELNSILFIW